MKENQIAFQRWYFKEQLFCTLGMLYTGDSLLLAYNTSHGEVDLEIKLAPIPCHFGGQRLYFLCPKCEKRIGVLYLNNSIFLCRVCSNVVYDVKSETEYDKMLRRSRKLRKQLGVEERPFGAIGSKDWPLVGKLVQLEEEMLRYLRLMLP